MVTFFIQIFSWNATTRASSVSIKIALRIFVARLVYRRGPCEFDRLCVGTQPRDPPRYPLKSQIAFLSRDHADPEHLWNLQNRSLAIARASALGIHW